MQEDKPLLLLQPVVSVPRTFWDAEFGDTPLPKAVSVVFEVAGQEVDSAPTQGFISLSSEDSELRLSGLWTAAQERFPGYNIVKWSKEGDDTVRLQLEPPGTGSNELDRKRRAPAGLPEPQAKVQAVVTGSGSDGLGALEQPLQGVASDWRLDVRDVGRPLGEPTQRIMSPAVGGRAGGRRGGAGGGRSRGGARGNASGRGCAKLVRTTTRLYIGVGQVREWLGEVGARTELQVKVMLDSRMLPGTHQADLLYNKGAHYYWITSRTLKRTAMGKWFLGWNHSASDGLVLLLRSPSKDEIAAAIAEGFQAKEEEEETEASEPVQQQQQRQQLHVQPQNPLQAFSPPSPRAVRVQQLRNLGAPASTIFTDEEQQLQFGAPEPEDAGDAAQGTRMAPMAGAVRLGPGDEEDAVSGDSGLRRALGPSDPRLMAALAAELTRGRFGAGSADAAQAQLRWPGQSQSTGPGSRLTFSGVHDSQEYQQLSGGSRQRTGSAAALSSGQAPFRTPSGHTISEGYGAQTVGAVAAAAVPRPAGVQGSRLTNFSEVPGGSAFGAVALPGDGHALEPMALAPPPQQQQQRSAAAAMPSQLHASTSIASNLSLAGVTQLTGTPSILQAQGASGAVVAPLRLPGNVSELLPPELLPAAVSVRCTLDGALLPDVFSCEIHRSRTGHCYLYNLPHGVLDGRSQQDWMISDDGCLVLCMTSVPAAPSLAENISVRSNTSNPQAGMLAAGGGDADLGGSRGALGARSKPSVEEPSLGRALRPNAVADLVPQDPPKELVGRAAAGPLMSAPEQREPFQQPPKTEPMDVDAALDPGYVSAPFPPEEVKAEPGRSRPAPLAVPRQAIASLYGEVELPLPVVVQYQVDGEPDARVYLGQVVDMNGELTLKGTPTDVLLNRTLVGWSKAKIMGHQLLVVCLESRSEPAAPQPKAGAQGAARADPGSRADPRAPPQRGRQLSTPQQSLQLVGSSELLPDPRARMRASSHANTYGQQVSFSGAPAPSSTLPTPRPSLQMALTVTGSLAPASRQQQLPPMGDSDALAHLSQHALQSTHSGLLAGVGSSKLPTSTSLLKHEAGLHPADLDAAGPRWRAGAGTGGRTGEIMAGAREQPALDLEPEELAAQRAAAMGRGFSWASTADADAAAHGNGSTVFALRFGQEATPSMDVKRHALPASTAGRAGGETQGMLEGAARGSLQPLGLEQGPGRAANHTQQLPAGGRENDDHERRKSSSGWSVRQGVDSDAGAAEHGGRRPIAAGAGKDEADEAALAAATLRFASNPRGQLPAGGWRLVELEHNQQPPFAAGGPDAAGDPPWPSRGPVAEPAGGAYGRQDVFAGPAPEGAAVHRLPVLSLSGRPDARSLAQAAGARGSDADGGDERELAEPPPGRQARSMQWMRDSAVPAEGLWHDDARQRFGAMEAGAQPSGAAGGGSGATRQVLLPGAPAPARQQWYPCLDLTDAPVDAERRELAAAEVGGNGHHEEAQQANGLDEPPPPRRPMVLRMLSAVEREPEEPAN